MPSRLYLILRAIRFWWQRRTRGFDDSVTWSLDYSVAKLILPRLRRFREVAIGTPGSYSDPEVNEWDEDGHHRWLADLDSMIWAFEFTASAGHWNAPSEDWERAQLGIELFAEHFFELWT